MIRRRIVPVTLSCLTLLAAGLAVPAGTDAQSPGPQPQPPPAPSVSKPETPDPDALVRNRLHLAAEYIREGRWDDALDLYRQIVDTHPKHPKALHGLKRCLLELKNYDELLLVLREELRDLPDHPSLLEELGTVYARMGDREAAASTWRRIIDAQKGSRGAYSMVADLMTRNRLLDDALDVFAEAERRYPGRFIRKKASLHELRFEFEQATEEYLTYLSQTPTALSVVEGRLLRIGEAEEGLGPVIRRVTRWIERQDEASSGGTSGPGVPGAGTPGAGTPGGLGTSSAQKIVYQKLLGDLHLESGNHEEARVQYFRLVDEAPRQASSLLTFGKRCQTDGEHDVAIRVFERVVNDLDDARTVPSALTEIGRSQQALERWDEALATYERLMADYPETDFAWAAKYEAGRIRRDGRGEIEAAEGLFRELIALGEGPWPEGGPQFEVAECAVWAGDLERARGIYQAVKGRRFAAPTKERALYEEARTWFYEANFPVADSLFKSVAQEHPRGDHVNDALQFSILINTNPDEPEVLERYASARLALRRGEPRTAVETLETLVNAFPGAAIADESLLLTGEALRADGDPERALAVLERAVAEAQVPDLAAEARLLRASILADELGNRAAALSEYEELLVAWPETLAADRARDLAAELNRMVP